MFHNIQNPRDRQNLNIMRAADTGYMEGEKAGVRMAIRYLKPKADETEIQRLTDAILAANPIPGF